MKKGKRILQSPSITPATYLFKDIATFDETGAVTATKAIENIRATELDCADWSDDILMEIVNAVVAGLQGQDYISKRKD